jgi:uncharacterized protein (UPF0297 family)
MSDKNRAGARKTERPAKTDLDDNPITEPRVGVYPEREASYSSGGRTPVVSRVSWGAVFAGTLVALMTQISLTLLGLGIGAATVSPATQQNPFEGLGIGAIIWFGLTVLVSLFVGGWIAARLAGIPRDFESVMHGIITWSVVTLVSFYLLTTAVGSLISGAANVVGAGLFAAGQAVGQATDALGPEAAQAVEDALEQRGISLQTIQDDAAEVLEQADSEQLNQFVGNLVTGDPVTSQQREEAITALEEGTDLSRAEAEQTVDGWIQTSEEAQQTFAEAEATAREVGEDVATGVTAGALGAFVATLLGAIAAGLGGRVGTPRDMPALTEARTRR